MKKLETPSVSVEQKYFQESFNIKWEKFDTFSDDDLTSFLGDHTFFSIKQIFWKTPLENLIDDINNDLYEKYNAYDEFDFTDSWEEDWDVLVMDKIMINEWTSYPSIYWYKTTVFFDELFYLWEAKAFDLIESRISNSFQQEKLKVEKYEIASSENIVNDIEATRLMQLNNYWYDMIEYIEDYTDLKIVNNYKDFTNFLSKHLQLLVSWLEWNSSLENYDLEIFDFEEEDEYSFDEERIHLLIERIQMFEEDEYDQIDLIMESTNLIDFSIEELGELREYIWEHFSSAIRSISEIDWILAKK